MTYLTAQYRAKNGVAQFEIFGERDGALYGRVKNEIADNIWYPCAWNLQIEGKSSVSDYYDIEPATPEQPTPDTVKTEPKDIGWPELFNAELTRMAAGNGLGHWRCVSTTTSKWWQRIDGKVSIHAPGWGATGSSKRLIFLFLNLA